jgi:hypothetical protein
MSSAQNANKLLCLNPYKAAVVPQLQHGLCSKTEFCELLPSLCVCRKNGPHTCSVTQRSLVTL